MNAQPKHAPAPYFVTPGTYPRIQDANGRNIAKTDCSLNGDTNWEKDPEKARANADLLAAAPELAMAALSAREMLGEMLRTAASNDQADAIDEVSSVFTAALAKAGLLS